MITQTSPQLDLARTAARAALAVLPTSQTLTLSPGPRPGPPSRACRPPRPGPGASPRRTWRRRRRPVSA
jgi:hypothetical protein